MDLARRVKQRREQLGLSQQELAIKMGYTSRTSINKIENGRAVSQKIIIRLANALETTPSFLMGWEIKLPNDVENNPDKLTENYKENMQYLKDRDEDELVELYKKIKTDKNLVMLVDKACELNPEQVEQILRIIDTFKKETAEKISNTKKYD